MDIWGKAKRSEVMGRICGKDTKPELLVRSLLHRSGVRFFLQRKDLPGRPDIVLPKHKAVVLVHGCFWHRHKGCPVASMPKSRKAFWLAKFKGNVERDRRNARALRQAGWKVLVVWECEVMRDPQAVLAELLDGLGIRRSLSGMINLCRHAGQVMMCPISSLWMRNSCEHPSAGQYMVKGPASIRAPISRVSRMRLVAKVPMSRPMPAGPPSACKISHPRQSRFRNHTSERNLGRAGPFGPASPNRPP